MHGAAAGAAAVVLFLAGAVVIGDRPAFDSGGAELAAWFDDERTRIQIACALNALAVPLLIWFLATVAWLSRTLAALVALACGLVFVAVFLADNTALAVGALRPDSSEDVLTALVDFELLAMGIAAPAASAMLIALGVVALRRDAIWPEWLGRLGLVAAAAYALRTATLFTTDGPFAADGVLGIYVPVAALAAWVVAASVLLARRERARAGAAA